MQATEAEAGLHEHLPIQSGSVSSEFSLPSPGVASIHAFESALAWTNKSIVIFPDRMPKVAKDHWSGTG